jgi:hypothetical protein
MSVNVLRLNVLYSHCVRHCYHCSCPQQPEYIYTHMSCYYILGFFIFSSNVLYSHCIRHCYHCSCPQQPEYIYTYMSCYFYWVFLYFHQMFFIHAMWIKNIWWKYKKTQYIIATHMSVNVLRLLRTRAVIAVPNAMWIKNIWWKYKKTNI